MMMIQDCALVVPCGPWCLTNNAPDKLENLSCFFSKEIICRAPYISHVQSSGLPWLLLSPNPPLTGQITGMHLMHVYLSSHGSTSPVLYQQH